MAGPAAAPRPGTTSDCASVRGAGGGGGMRGSPEGRRGIDAAAARRSQPAAAMDRVRGSGFRSGVGKFWEWRGNGVDLAVESLSDGLDEMEERGRNLKAGRTRNT